MARLIADFSLGEEEYGDGGFETELLDIVSNNEDLEPVLKTEKRWPIVYQLSHLRQNLLNWYPFKKDADILEVGAGCGALTGFLCGKAAHVTAVELASRRAEINYRRNRGRDNLDIYVGDIFKIDLKQKFDYVTVIGFLEYAAFLSQAKDPYSEFLSRIKSFLKPGGHILLAIENRFGLRYFAGAREDHTARFFDGINGYCDDNKIRTFTKAELEKLLNSNELGAQRFYYPLPDYKFPSCVYTDESIGGFDRWMDLGTLDNQRFELFSEIGVMRDFASEGVLDKFANSFIVDAAADGTELENSILMAKLSATRNKQYRIATVIKQIDGEKVVEKVPLDQECLPHLRQMADNYANMGSLHGIKLVPCHTAADGRAVFDFAKGEKFSSLISRELSDKGTDALWPLLDCYRKKIFDGAKKVDFYTEEFQNDFGTVRCEGELLCVSPANIDLTFDNLVLNDDGSMTAVDYEWIANFAIPSEYIFWRSVFFTDVFVTKDALKEKIFEHYKITKAMRGAFYSWEIAFSTNKIGNASIEGKANIKLDLNYIDPQTLHGEVITNIAFDTGKGFDMENTVSRSICRLGQPCTIKVPLGKGVKSIRFDPIEGFACQCHINSVKCKAGLLGIRPLNSVASDEGSDFFLTRDPVYIIDCDFTNQDSIEISFTVSELDPSLADLAISKSANVCRAKFEQLDARNNELQRFHDSVINSRSWKLTAPIRKFKKVFAGNS